MSIHLEPESKNLAAKAEKMDVRRVLGVSAGAGRSLPGRCMLFLGCAYLFLWVPDFDFALISILHHRSIITHSLLPALVFVFLGRSLGAAPIAGALIGTSVHLSCDMLSPMVGYAQIWFPAPIKAPLGPLSYLWLFGNAMIGFALASLIASLAFPRSFAYPLVASVAIITGATYGAINEGSVLSIITVLIIIVFSLFPEGYIRRRWGRSSRAGVQE
ncbi:hypothetical protein OO012_14910 [Rhodobacteraceae bacterium KMM 6894]|nr:hypothetical protein [Rhodobacteraceae bacterium KMM 6894]